MCGRILAAVALVSLPASAQQPLSPPVNAPYLAPNGAIRIIGTDSFRWTLERADALFTQAHPGFRFELELKGGYIAMPQLAEHTTAFTPMAREVIPAELAGYRARVHADPLVVRIAHGTVTSQTRTGALAVYVSRANPLTRLTTAQLAAIFSTGNPGGDITRWGQAGLTGEWADRPIHPVGTPEDSGFGSWMVAHLEQGRGFRPGYQQLLSTAEIVRRVESDPAAIGVGAIDFLTPGVRMVALAETPAGPYSLGSAEDVHAGRYPLDRYVYLFLRPEQGGSIAPWVKAYVRLLLSPAIQHSIGDEPEGFIPLNEAEIAAELEKLR